MQNGQPFKCRRTGRHHHLQQSLADQRNQRLGGVCLVKREEAQFITDVFKIVKSVKQIDELSQIKSHLPERVCPDVIFPDK